MYRGSNNQIQGVTWDGSAWVHAPFPANPPGAPNDGHYKMGDDPAAFKRSGSADSYLYRPLNCANCVGEHRLVGSTYYRGTTPLSTSFRPGTHPRGLRDVDGNATIFVATEGGVYWLRAASASDSVISYTQSRISTLKANSSPVPFYNNWGSSRSPGGRRGRPS